jgi:hypothetical protein
MKQTTNFPYDVAIHTVDLKELPQSADCFEYEIILPDYYLTDEKYLEVAENLELIAETNCSATMYREVFDQSENFTLSIAIPRNKVSVKFSIDILLVAKKEFNWDSQQLRKGMPLAHFGSFQKDIDNRSTGLISFESTYEDKISISNSDHTIKVKIPVHQFKFLIEKQNSLLVKQILTSQFAQIALLESCKELKENSKRDNLLWYKELLSRWRKFSNNEDEYPQESDHLKFVSDLLENPSIKLIDYLIAEEKQKKDE